MQQPPFHFDGSAFELSTPTALMPTPERVILPSFNRCPTARLKAFLLREKTDLIVSGSVLSWYGRNPPLAISLSYIFAASPESSR